MKCKHKSEWRCEYPAYNGTRNVVKITITADPHCVLLLPATVPAHTGCSKNGDCVFTVITTDLVTSVLSSAWDAIGA